MRTKKLVQKMLLCFLIAIVIIILPENAMQVFAAIDCLSIEGGNKEEQNYDYLVYSDTIKSYLSYNGKQLMKVQADDNYKGVLIEYYDMNYKLLSNRVIPQELPIFGGFYETNSNYYLVTGQKNLDASDSVEVFRVTKYDKSWNKIDSVGFLGCNTTIPFNAGSLRFTDCGKWLIIRTSREMYSKHQANITIQINTETMDRKDCHIDDFGFTRFGYVSHSFNQFIAIDNDKIISLDHGDAAPRSLVLMKCSTEVLAASEYELVDRIETTVMEFPGEKGDNVTGASVGGFEVASDYYLIAGNSVIQDSQNTKRETRNIFISAVSKATDKVTTRWFTNYAEGEGTVSNPHFVKISNSEYLLMWTREETIYYVKVDSTGKQVGSIYSMDGSLSDCKPIVADGKVIWYVWENETITFYQISLSNLKSTSNTEVVTGHRYKYKSTSNGYAKMKCNICGNIENIQVSDSINLLWDTDKNGDYLSSEVDTTLNVNQIIYCEWYLEACDRLAEDVEIENSNSNVIELKIIDDRFVELIAKNVGEATISFWPKYNSDAKKTFTFKVFEEGIVPVESISINTNPINLEIGESYQLDVIVEPENATDKKIFYESADTSIATVSDDGLIMAVGEGDTIVTITAADGNAEADWQGVHIKKTSNNGGLSFIVNTPPENGWYEKVDGKYWYENGVRQGTEGRGKEIYDPSTDAWYWLDAVNNGKVATNKDVYQESSGGKWVRYDENGRMIKGEDYRYGGWYYFEPITGTMMKGPVTLADGRKVFYDTVTGQMVKGEIVINGQTYVFDQENGNLISGSESLFWIEIDGKKYWYENWQRQGWDTANENYRGKEIFDPISNAWYWLDNVQQGAMAASKDVYQESSGGKWVRYNENGAMIKGWNTNYNGTYYFDLTTGAMIKGEVVIDGISYYFDENTGILK